MNNDKIDPWKPPTTFIKTNGENSANPEVGITPEKTVFENELKPNRKIISENGKYGFTNLEGKVCIPIVYEAAESFYDFGLAKVKQNGNWGLIDINGFEKIPIKYDEILLEQCYDGFVAKIDKKWKFIDRNGNDNLSFEFEDISLSDNSCFIKIGGKWGKIGKNEREIFEPKFTFLYNISDINIAIVKYEGFWGMIDKLGNSIVSFEYTHFKKLYYTDNGYLHCYEKDNKWILADEKGLKNKDTYYDEIGEFKDGWCLVKRNNRFGFIDKTGKEILPVIYEQMEHQMFLGKSKIKRVAIKLNGKWGFIDENGNIIIGLIYDEILPFEVFGTTFKAKVKKIGSEWIEIDSIGNGIVEEKPKDYSDFIAVHMLIIVPLIIFLLLEVFLPWGYGVALLTFYVIWLTKS